MIAQESEKSLLNVYKDQGYGEKVQENITSTVKLQYQDVFNKPFRNEKKLSVSHMQ